MIKKEPVNIKVVLFVLLVFLLLFYMYVQFPQFFCGMTKFSARRLDRHDYSCYARAAAKTKDPSLCLKSYDPNTCLDILMRNVNSQSECEIFSGMIYEDKVMKEVCLKIYEVMNLGETTP